RRHTRFSRDWSSDVCSSDLEPTDEEVAIELEMPVNKVAHLKSVSVRPTSLDAPVGEDDSTEFGDLVGDENAVNPLDHLKSKSLRSEEHTSELQSRENLVCRL